MTSQKWRGCHMQMGVCVVMSHGDRSLQTWEKTSQTPVISDKPWMFLYFLGTVPSVWTFSPDIWSSASLVTSLPRLIISSESNDITVFTWNVKNRIVSVADPGFPVGGAHQPPIRLRFVKFVCQYERYGNLGRGREGGWVRPLDPPLCVRGPELIWQINVNNVWIIHKINLIQFQVHMNLRGLNLEIT